MLSLLQMGNTTASTDDSDGLANANTRMLSLTKVKYLHLAHQIELRKHCATQRDKYMDVLKHEAQILDDLKDLDFINPEDMTDDVEDLKRMRNHITSNVEICESLIDIYSKCADG